MQSPEQMDATYPAVQAFLDRHVLQYMDECVPDDFCCYLASLTNEWITKDMARGIVRSLTDRGFCRYESGLFTEDGEVAGSGYGITRQGREHLRTLQ